MKKLWNLIKAIFSSTLFTIVLVVVVFQSHAAYFEHKGWLRGYDDGVDHMKHELVETGYAEYWRDSDKKSQWRMKSFKTVKSK